jgi:hypothetical protein
LEPASAGGVIEVRQRSHANRLSFPDDEHWHLAKTIEPVERDVGLIRQLSP